MTVGATHPWRKLGLAWLATFAVTALVGLIDRLVDAHFDYRDWAHGAYDVTTVVVVMASTSASAVYSGMLSRRLRFGAGLVCSFVGTAPVLAILTATAHDNDDGWFLLVSFVTAPLAYVAGALASWSPVKRDDDAS